MTIWLPDTLHYAESAENRSKAISCMRTPSETHYLFNTTVELNAMTANWHYCRQQELQAKNCVHSMMGNNLRPASVDLSCLFIFTPLLLFSVCTGLCTNRRAFACFVFGSSVIHLWEEIYDRPTVNFFVKAVQLLAVQLSNLWLYMAVDRLSVA